MAFLSRDLARYWMDVSDYVLLADSAFCFRNHRLRCFGYVVLSSRFRTLSQKTDRALSPKGGVVVVPV